jgi:hypothetical protein
LLVSLKSFFEQSAVFELERADGVAAVQQSESEAVVEAARYNLEQVEAVESDS